MTRITRKRLAALVVTGAVAATGLIGLAPPAGAATGTLSGATFEWTISDETNAASFNGQCNYWAAGPSDGTSTDYVATEGNATVLKLNASDQYVPISDYAARCLDQNGQAVNTTNGAGAKRLGQKVRLTGGTGTLDPATGASIIQWTGTWTVNFYGTAVPFWFINPKLVVDTSGNGTVTATMGGFASDINNPDVKVPLPETPNVVIATLTGVSGANTTGFTSTPKYSEVVYEVDPESGMAPQNRTSAGWGAWPTSFVDFQMDTGLGSYWYSSGSSSIDARKAPTALTIGYGTYTPPAPTLTVNVTPNTNVDNTVTNNLAVTGSGFFGFGAAESGVYVGLVPASKWQPGQVPNQADFIGTTFVPKQAIVGGALSTTVTVDPSQITDLDESYGIGTICAHGCANTNRGFDNFTPISFAPSNPANMREGVAFTYSVPSFEGGIAPFHWAISGSGVIPPGLSFDTETGVVKGMPTTTGVYKTTFKVTDSKLPKPKAKSVKVEFRVAPANFVIAPTTVPDAQVGVQYEQQLSASGGTAPYKFKITSGLSEKKVKLSGKGLLKGKPASAGEYFFTVTATDKNKFTQTRSYTLTVNSIATT